MATDTRNLFAFFNVDADFQAYCQGIAAQLVAAGMVKTADTGQINNATVVKPTINTASGYEIYRFNDSLQSTTPVYFKIEYGGGAAADRPSLWITTGTGSNGAGTLTGNLTTRTQLSAGASKVATNTLPSYCSGDGSRVVLMTNYDVGSTTFGIFLTIDRLRDNGGGATSDGFYVTGWCSSGVAGIVGSNIGGTVNQANNFGWIGTRSSTSSQITGYGQRSFNNQLAMMPPIVLAGQLRYLSTFVMYTGTDIAGQAPSTVQINNFGVAHTYLLGKGLSGNQLIVGGLDDIAIIWE